MPLHDLEKKRAYNRSYAQRRRASDPAYVEKQRSADRERYWANPEKHRAERLERYRADPEKARLATSKWRKKLAPEKIAEQYLLENVEKRGGLCPKFIDPSRRGAPDRMVLLPGRQVYFVEMKRAKLGKLASHQERYHDSLRAVGQRVWVLWSKEDVDAFFAGI
jgi:hypothetical protein